ncbi:MAG TPA: heavy metal transport/detoxification protein [Firmicutes bacterium]|nr:heavy metal transport/detoxification protein [Bacillota bacterium]
MFNTKIKKVITIEGMMCEHCKMKVERALSELNGVSKVKVNLKNKTATIYSTKSISNDDIKNSISKLDYKVINIVEDE